MNKLRENEQTAAKPIAVNLSNNNDVEMSTSTSDEIVTKDSSSNNSEKKSDSPKSVPMKSEEPPSPVNPCALCLTEEKCIAFVPCGHVAACVACGHSVRSCPICRGEIKALVRVYL